MKRFILLILLFIATTVSFGQNKLTDSLKYLLSFAQEDTTRVLTMAELGLQFRNSNPDSSIIYGRKALALAKQIRFQKGEALALSNIGLAMREKGDLPAALELEIQALQIAEENNYVNELAFGLRRVGLVYMDLRNYSVALTYLYRALHKHKSVKYERGIAIEHMNLGMTYEYMDKLDSALFHIQKAEAGKNYIEDLYPEVNRVFGNIYAKKGNKELALHYYNKGIQAGLKLNDLRTISFINADVAGMFRRVNETDSSIAYAKKGVEYGQRASYKKGILFSSTILSELYDSIDPKVALHYYKIAAAAKDSLFGAGNIQTIQSLISNEEARQKEIELAKAAYQNQLKKYGLLTGLGLFLIIAFILYRNNREKQRTNKVLEATLNNLKSTQSQLIQSEKMASLGELTAGIAHEIQNPLNFVNNFSEVNEELLSELKDELSKGKMEDVIALANDAIENQKKINHHGKRADAIVKGMLQHSRASSGTKEPTDINALCDEYLRLSYHGLRAKDKSFNAIPINIGIETNFDPTIEKFNIIPQDIGRVILNLINNAFYAVNEKKEKLAHENYEPTVTVITKKLNVRPDDSVGRGKIQIIIKDNGSGIPESVKDKIFQPFFTTKPTGQGTGLGLSLSYDIVKAHGGEIKVVTIQGSGTDFIIDLPMEKGFT